MSKYLVLLLAIPALFGCSTHCKCTDSKVIGPFVDESVYTEVVAELPKPPKPDSKEQKQDVKILKDYQKNRTKAQCDQAEAEVRPTFESMFVQPESPLTKAQVDELRPFFQEVRNEVGPWISRLKMEYKRPRPYNYLKGLKPCVDRDNEFGYPSGHAMLSKLYSLILINLYPQNSNYFERRAFDFAEDRVLAGVHHPTDIEAGKQVATIIYGRMLKSETFQNELNKHRPEDKPADKH